MIRDFQDLAFAGALAGGSKQINEKRFSFLPGRPSQAILPGGAFPFGVGFDILFSSMIAYSFSFSFSFSFIFFT